MIKKVRAGILISILFLHFSLPSFAMEADDEARNTQARRYTKEDVIAAWNSDLDYVAIRRQMTAITRGFTAKGLKTDYGQQSQLTEQMKIIALARKAMPVPETEFSLLQRTWMGDDERELELYYTIMLQDLEGSN